MYPASPTTSYATPRLAKQIQSSYASDSLPIPTLGFAKLSVLILLRTISPVKLHHNIILAMGILITVWAVVAEFVAAFQCHMSPPWRFIGNKCINRVSTPVSSLSCRSDYR